jgi:hypothetical protein
MTGCLKNIPEHMNWWEEFESSHDAPQAPHIDGAGGQSGRIGFLLAPWNSQKFDVNQIDFIILSGSTHLNHSQMEIMKPSNRHCPRNVY